MADTEFTIREAGPEDAAMLAALGARTFSDSFANDNTTENMANYLRQSFSPEIQAAELAQQGSIFLILETEDGTPIGYTRLLDGSNDPCLRDSTAWGGLHTMELIRIYLLESWTGRRLGDVLMQASLAQAQKHNAAVLWLGVWQQNPRAVAFYKRWGFEIAGTHTFQLGDDPQQDYVMARRVE